MADLWIARIDRYSETRERTAATEQPHAEMAYLGG